MRTLAIDFETANHRRDSACAVGVVWIEDGRVVRRVERLIRPPDLDFAPGNIRVHGIRPRDVVDAPAFPEAMADILPQIEGGLVLAHNARFDVGVLVASLGAYGRSAPDFAWLCTLAVSRRTWPGERRHGLAHAAARIGHAFQHHHAGADAEACARIALAAAEVAGVGGVAALVTALGLDLGRVAGGRLPPPRPSPLRPLPHRPGSRLAFEVAGRRGDAYAIDILAGASWLRARCTCAAGRAALRCHHVTALLDGEIDALRSGNADDVERLRRLVLAVGAEAVHPPERRAA